MTDMHTGLRAWARGIYPLEAAVELLTRAFGGRFARDGWVWVRRDEQGRAWIDFDVLAEEAAYGPWSGGERRVLAIAASLGASDHPVDLHDVLPGMDADAHALVVAAVRHAGGDRAAWEVAADGV